MTFSSCIILQLDQLIRSKKKGDKEREREGKNVMATSINYRFGVVEKRW